MSIVLYVTLVICAFCAGLLVYRHDLYERESVPMLFLATVIGAGAMWCAGQVESWTFDLFDIRSGHALAAIAALEEELFKLLVVVAFALLVRKEFNDPMDGLVYGSIAGLGMALEESLYYLRDLSEGGGASLPPAELVRMLGHLVMGGISGYAVGPLSWGAATRDRFSSRVSLQPSRCTSAGIGSRYRLPTRGSARPRSCSRPLSCLLDCCFTGR